MPIFVDRVAELPRLLDELQYHPEGLPIAELAMQVGRTPEQVREILLTYYATDFARSAPDLMWRPVPVEFVGTSDEEDDEQDPYEASIVRLVEESPGRQLGVAYVPLSELARMYRIGSERLDLEPDNAILRSAVDKLRAGLLPGVLPSRRSEWSPPREFEAARVEHRKIKISYARAWHPGIVERTVEPYRLVQTRRGWELDAGPVQANGRLRTYLLNRIREFDVLDETFEPSAEIAELLRAQRAPTVVVFEVPHEARWAVEKQAESVEVVGEDETSVRLWAGLLAPLRHRVGLILIDAGPAAGVIEPAELADAGRELARTLLSHHDASPG